MALGSLILKEPPGYTQTDELWIWIFELSWISMLPPTTIKDEIIIFVSITRVTSQGIKTAYPT